MKRTLIVAMILVCAISAHAQQPSSEQMNPALERGLHPEKLYHFNDFDNVSIFNGNLGIALPIGPSYAVDGGLTYQLKLRYNSKFWDFDRSYPTGSNQDEWVYAHAYPSKASNAGLGWTLGFGRFIGPRDVGGSDFPVWEAPDGGQHPFTRHIDGASFTTDGTNLRYREVNGDIEVHFPDGVVQRHVRNVDGDSWELFEIRAARGPGKITIGTHGGAPECGSPDDGYVQAWKISDTELRTHFVCFQEFVMDDAPRPMVTKVVFEAVPGQPRITYGMHYEPKVNIPWAPGEADYPTTPPSHAPWRTTHDVQVLKTVVLPDESQWEFEYNWSEAYISAVTLPTRARIEYTYGRMPDPENLPNHCPQPQPIELPSEGLTDAVTVRTVIPAVPAGAPAERHVWTYDRTLQGVQNFTPNSCRDYAIRWDEMVVAVKDPAGAVVESHFTMWHQGEGTSSTEASISDNGFSSDHYGLPWGKYDSTQNRYLSQVHKDCSTEPCKTLRTTYVRHEIVPNSFTDTVRRRNPIHRLESQAVYDHGCTADDDPTNPVRCTTSCATEGEGTLCPSTITEFTEWDGFAHYRVQTSSYDFGGDNKATKRVTTNWNVGRVIANNQPWVLDVYDTRTTEETGQPTITEQVCIAIAAYAQKNDAGGVEYPPGNGFVRGKRLLAGPIPGEFDLITRYEQSPIDFNLRGEKYYGGEATPLPAAAVTASNLCAALDALDATTPAFATTHTWKYGQIETSKHTAAPFFALDLTLHPSGVATSSRDSAEQVTSYTYDKAARIKQIAPPEGAPTSYDYSNASAEWDGTVNRLLQPATALQRIVSPDGNVESHYEFDSLGRVVKEKKLLPNDELMRQEHAYDGLGRKTSTTVWGTDASLKATRFTYDSMGRTTEITAPDDSKVAFEYVGSRFKTRKEWIWDGTQNREARTTEEYDGFGRLVKVTEQSATPTGGHPDGKVVTEYKYNAADQLISVKINGIQPRVFQYDGRRLLKAEDHPESNSTSYTYDARGHVVTRVVDAAPQFNLHFGYDSSERLVTVDGPDKVTPIKKFEFANANGAGDYRKGKLWKTTRWNYPPAPEPGLDARQDKIVVEETYAYGRSNGAREHQRTTKITSHPDAVTSTVMSQFTQSTKFNELDLPAVVTYPSLTGCAEPCAPGRNSVTTYYKNGRVDRLSEAITSISYSPNGMWSERKRSSGINDVQAPDPDGMARPLSIGVNVPPVCDLIANQPAATQSIAPGGPATFTVTVNGTATTPAFQWYSGARGDTRQSIPGATLSSLTINSVTATSSYWVRVTSNGCSEDSQTATVDICSLISSHPVGITVNKDQPATLTVGAAANATFQWYKGLRGDTTNPVANANGATLNISAVTATANYWVRVTYGSCTQDSLEAKVTMCAPFTIVNPPAVVPVTTVIKNVELTFNVDATGDLLSYAWYLGTGPGRTLLGTGVQVKYTPGAVTTAANPTIIEVEVKNGCTIETRTAARLVVNGELPPCVADVTLAPYEMNQTTMPNQQLILRTISRLLPPAGNASSYTDIKYRFQWYLQGALAQDHLSEGVKPPATPALPNPGEQDETALSEFLVRFTGQTWTRVDATVICTSGTQTVTSPVQSFKSFAFQFGHCPVPDVVSVPAAAVVRDNAPVTLTADSIYPWATFEWYSGESGNAHPDRKLGTTATLTVTDSGTYWVRAFSECGAHADSPTVVVSKDGTGGVCTPVRIQADPQEKNVAAFAPLTLTVSASGSPAPNRYIWSTSVSENVPGQGTATMSINPGPRKTTDYTVYVANDCSGVYSRAARVHVTSCAGITIHVPPLSSSIANGDVATVSINATADGGAQLYYQWYEGESGDTSIPVGGLPNTPQYDASKHGPTLQLGTPGTTKRYWVRLSFNDPTKCEVDSATATVSVCSTPVLTNTPTNRNSAGPGLDQSFSVTATGENLSYAWYEGSNLNDETRRLSTTRSLEVYPRSTTDYYVKVTSDCVPEQADRVVKVPFKISVCPDFRGDETPTAASTLVSAGTTTTLSVDVDRGDRIEWYMVVGTAAPVKFDEGGPTFTTVTTPNINVESKFFARAFSGNCSRDTNRITISVCSTPRIHWSSGPTQVAKGAPFWLVTGLALGETANFKFYRGTTAGDVANSTLMYSSSNAYNVAGGIQATTSYWVRAWNETTGCYSDTPVRTITVCVPTIVTQPQSVTINPNTSTTLSVTTDNLAGVSYKWYLGQPGDTSAPVPNGTAASVSVSPTVDTTYWVQIKGCPAPLDPATIDSQAATVTICKVAKIEGDLGPRQVTRNSNVTLSVTASGDGLHYQWYEGALNDTTKPVGTDSSAYTFNATVSKRFWVRVTGNCGTASSTAPLVSVDPLISTHPLSQAVTKGSTRTLTVASATGTELRYEWYQRSGATSTLMSGTTSSPTFLTPVLNADSTFYAKVFSGTASTLSNDAVLTVCAVGTINSTGTNSQMSGTYIRLSIDAPAAGETYQWYRGNSPDTANPIANATASQLDVAPLETTNYWVRITRATCSADSATKTVTMCRPAITTQPVSKTITKGNSTTLTVAGTGTGPLTYEWFTGTPGGSNTVIPGATSSTLSITPTATTTYFARMQSPSGCATRHTDSTVATVTVCTPVSITADLTPKQLPRNASTSFTIGAAGDGLHYQWYEGAANDTSKPVGTDSTTYAFTTSVTKRFWVRVTGSCGNPVPSSEALVSVEPLISTHPLSQAVTKGTTRELSVASATGTELRYEWYQRNATGSTLLSGATSSPTFTTPVINADSTFYAKVFSGTASTLSNDAVLSLCAPSTFTVTSSSQVSGGVVRLSIDSPAAGETFQWFRKSGATSVAVGTGSVVDLQPLETTTYWVRTTRATCTADSAERIVNVCRPNITTQPLGATIANGTSTVLSVAATGTGPLAYEWFIGPPNGGGQLILGANQSTYPAAPTSTTTYYARVHSSSNCGTRYTDSSPATVTVCNGPKIENQDSTKQVPYNYRLTLQVIATGDDLHYQWYEGPVGTTTKPVGTDNFQYIFMTDKNTTYWVRISGSCGAPKDSAPMDIHVNPHIQTQPVNAIACGSGGIATFTVQAYNVQNYQWYRQFTGQAAEMVGTNLPKLDIAVSNTSAQYWVVMTAGFGKSQSNKVSASIGSLPTVTSFAATQQTSTTWQLKALVASADYNLVKYKFYEGQHLDTSKPLADTTVNNRSVVPTATSRTYWVRVYYYETAPYCYVDRVVTIP